jgi:hypothetical protein
MVAKKQIKFIKPENPLATHIEQNVKGAKLKPSRLKTRTLSMMLALKVKWLPPTIISPAPPFVKYLPSGA